MGLGECMVGCHELWEAVLGSFGVDLGLQMLLWLDLCPFARVSFLPDWSYFVCLCLTVRYLDLCCHLESLFNLFFLPSGLLVPACTSSVLFNSSRLCLQAAHESHEPRFLLVVFPPQACLLYASQFICCLFASGYSRCTIPPTPRSSTVLFQ